MRDLIAPLLFGTTPGPLVSQIAFGFEWGWIGLAAGVVGGIICGGLMVSMMITSIPFILATIYITPVHQRV